MRIVLKVIEGDKLYDISWHILSVRLWVEGLFISVKNLHGLKISITNTNNDDSQVVDRSSYNLINCLIHVSDDSIGNDHKNVELLNLLWYVFRLTVVIYLIEDVREIGWTIKITFAQSILVALHYWFQTIYSWIEDVSIHSKAVRGSIGIWWYCTPKTIQCNLFISIVELKDISDTLNCLKILISLWVEIMKRIWLSWVSIGQGEVNSNA